MLVCFLNAIKFLGFYIKNSFNQKYTLKLQIPLQNNSFWQL